MLNASFGLSFKSTFLQNTSGRLPLKNKHLNNYDGESKRKRNIDQGGLNKKEIRLNLCTIFSVFVFNEFYLFA